MNSVKILQQKSMTFKETDTSNVFEFQLMQGEVPQDLTGALVNLVIKNSQGIVLNKAVVATDALNGIVSFMFTDDDYIGSGYMVMEFVVVYPNNSKEIFPQNKYININVVPRLKGEEVDLEPDSPTISMEFLQSEIQEVKKFLEEDIGNIKEVLDLINGEVI